MESLSDAEQERVIGRTKPNSVELDDKPADSHVAYYFIPSTDSLRRAAAT